MKIVEIIWFITIMLLCAIADSNNTVIMLTLVVLVVPFVIYLIKKTAKQVAINEIKKEKEVVKTVLKEK